MIQHKVLVFVIQLTGVARNLKENFVSKQIQIGISCVCYYELDFFPSTKLLEGRHFTCFTVFDEFALFVLIGYKNAIYEDKSIDLGVFVYLFFFAKKFCCAGGVIIFHMKWRIKIQNIIVDLGSLFAKHTLFFLYSSTKMFDPIFFNK
ncbi:hypothetical protein RFI_18167 [Reticulomyxa filosa]|uniref:Uncharacterized protein n=1 Tax=Reticulomyxa filosa TaxID=46433 RepID=X6MYG5_RETFI|nr:hypothetical protein RFI_18167 [Reticulomyxa filosa]|eukprot:ETO19070.1 hypothetical protein RFI_18167 [Reticulomyxa filosa]